MNSAPSGLTLGQKSAIIFVTVLLLAPVLVR